MKLSRSPHPLDDITDREYPYHRPVEVFLWLAVLLVAGLLCGACSHLTPDTREKWSQTGQYLATRAETIAGRVILNAAFASLNSSDADFLDSAAAGLRSETTNIVTSADVEKVLSLWTPKAPQWVSLADQLADTYREASAGAPAPVVLEALASGLNRAAAGDRLP